MLSPAKRIRRMIKALEEIETEYRAKQGLTHGYTQYLDELQKAKQALERLYKDSVG